MLATLTRHATLALLAASTSLAAQDALLARDDGGRLDLTAVTAGVPQLVADDVEPLRLELLGVARRDRFASGAPRPVPRQGLVPDHVRLPDGRRVWRARRAGLDRLLVLGPGAELSEAFAAAAGETIAPGVAVSLDGARLAAAVDGPGGAHVALVDLASGASASLAAPGLLPTSLRLRGGRAWFVDESGVVHSVDVASLAVTSSPLPLGPGETALADLAVGLDGSRAAVVAEAAPELRRVLAVAASGAVTLVTPTPGDYDTPCHECPGGPLIAVAPDGSAVAFREETDGLEPFRDVVVRALAAPQPQTVTGDAAFIDTLNDVGVISFVSPTLVTFLLGERGEDAGVVLDSADAFAATLDASGAATGYANLTGTSNDASAPFTVPGQLEVLDVALDPLGARVLWVVDPQGGDAELLVSPPSGTGAPVTVVTDLEAVPLLRAVGDTIVSTAPPSEDLFPPGSTRIDVFPPLAVGSPRLLGVVAPDIDVSRFAANASDTELALVVSVHPTTELGVVVDTASGAAAALTSGLFAWGPGLAYDAAGTLVSAVGVPGASIVVAWAGPGTAVKVPTGVGVWQPIDLR